MDVVVIHDYDVICEDFPDEATAMSWTPNGLFLVVCDKNTVVQEVMGSDLWHVGSYSEWDSGSAAVSGKLRTMPFNSMQSRLKCFVLCWFDIVHLFTIHFLVV